LAVEEQRETHLVARVEQELFHPSQDRALSMGGAVMGRDRVTVDRLMLPDVGGTETSLAAGLRE
jgi:hypothetical protein